MLGELLDAYPDAPDRFDELFEAPLRPRRHWARMYAELVGTPAGEINERLSSAERQIRDSGITYNVYADPEGLDRPWDLDVMPLILPPQEWERIEQGIAQRANLFNRILGDLYGPQELLAQGLIPPALVYGHSGFLRPAHGIRPPGDVYLHVYAADLARSPDGNWWVMADRTQSPSGAGYALENRLIVSRAFPRLFRDMRVEHVARFFAALREGLRYYAPRGDGPNLTVLLTPGPFNETYFEHALLARYLGFPLVEGTDLTVRDGRVWLKTIGGLKRVHAILRRQDDAYCDPLELRSDSALGVPGLAQCARQQTVLIANALGSGLLESGALLGFLPRLAEHLTGNELILPSIATWWCGEKAALDDALDQVESLVFKPADPAYGFEPIFGQDLDAAGLTQLRRRLASHPERHVAQELVRMSQAPVLSRGPVQRLSARGICLRVFAVATPGGYVVMPGGLTRVASTRDARVVSMQRGGGSKDTWVISTEPVDASFTLLSRTVDASGLIRSGGNITSRIAERLFWLGRYEERCEDAARLLRIALNQSLQANDDRDHEIAPVRALARAFGLLETEDVSDQALITAATLESHPLGLAQNLRQLERTAFDLRDRMSLDNWRTINRLIKDPMFNRPGSLADTLNWLDRNVTSLMTLSGFALDGMTRDHGWRFLSIGRRLERLTFGALALQVACREGLHSGLGWLLELADSSVTYQARYPARPEWLPVLDLLVLDQTNPRSIVFQVRGINDFLRRLEDAFGPCGCEAFATASAAFDRLDAESDLVPESTRLAAALAGMRHAAFELSETLTQRFFNHGHEASWCSLAL